MFHNLGAFPRHRALRLVASSRSIGCSSFAVAHHIAWSSKPAAHSTFRQWPQSQRPSSSCSSSISVSSFQTLRLASASQSVMSSSTSGQAAILFSTEFHTISQSAPWQCSKISRTSGSGYAWSWSVLKRSAEFVPLHGPFWAVRA